jgi:hypothetical protein
MTLWKGGYGRPSMLMTNSHRASSGPFGHDSKVLGGFLVGWRGEGGEGGRG